MRALDAWSPDYPKDVLNWSFIKQPVDGIATDPLTAGVKTARFSRPAPIRIRDPKVARLLVGPAGTDFGYSAVARAGKGEVVVLGVGLLPQWLDDEHSKGSDNARFLRNLLTTPVPVPADRPR